MIRLLIQTLFYVTLYAGLAAGLAWAFFQAAQGDTSDCDETATEPSAGSPYTGEPQAATCVSPSAGAADNLGHGTAAVTSAAVGGRANAAGPADGCRVVRMKVTAYCPCEICCGPQARGVTASGKPVTANGRRFVAADPAIPFGTMISVPGYAGGQRVPVLDRGGAIKGNHIDVYFASHRHAREWGVRWLDVTIYGKGN